MKSAWATSPVRVWPIGAQNGQAEGGWGEISKSPASRAGTDQRNSMGGKPPHGRGRQQGPRDRVIIPGPPGPGQATSRVIVWILRCLTRFEIGKPLLNDPEC